MFENLLKDIAYAGRMLRKNLGFAAAAILTLALGTEDKTLAALDLLAMIRALVDAAGDRREKDQTNLAERVNRAACGYLQFESIPGNGAESHSGRRAAAARQKRNSS